MEPEPSQVQFASGDPAGTGDGGHWNRLPHGRLFSDVGFTSKEDFIRARRFHAVSARAAARRLIRFYGRYWVTVDLQALGDQAPDYEGDQVADLALLLAPREFPRKWHVNKAWRTMIIAASVTAHEASWRTVQRDLWPGDTDTDTV